MNRRHFILTLLILLALPLFASTPMMKMLLRNPVQAASGGGGGIVATDNFSRADSGSLGANWTTFLSGSLTILNNTASGLSSQFLGNIWTANTFHNDQYIKLTVGLVSSGSFISDQAIIRGSGVYPAYNAYIMQIYDNGLTLSAVVAGSATTLGTFSGSINPGDIVELSVTGSSVSASINGTTEITVSDSSLITGTPGIGTFNSATIQAVELGNVD